MSKPHLAIQNQAVKYAQKDIHGNDIVQYDYVAVDLTLSINNNNIPYLLYIRGLYIDIKYNYKKLLNKEDITLHDVLQWIIPLVQDENGTAYLSGGDMSNVPVLLMYNEIGRELYIADLDNSDILHDVTLDTIETAGANININPLTENLIIYEY